MGDQACPSCGRKYAIHGGVLDFTPEDRFYWGEIPQDDMIRVNRRAEETGWFQAFRETIVGKSKRDLSKYVLDRVRIAGLFHYYDPKRSDACLDLGSGWGPISFGLSRFYSTVYSIDGVYDRLEFQAIRAKQDRVSNVTIIKSSLLKIPLTDQSMDVVIVNGLLEWIGLSDEGTDPQALQIHFLEEVHRVLKSGGKIFIGIENRVGVYYLMGGRDHSGLRFTSLMPRWLASLVVRMTQRGEGASVFSGATSRYRTLTYSYWGYQKLLNQAGFQQPKVYWTWPSYNYPYASGTLDGVALKEYLGIGQSQINSRLKRAIIQALKLVPNLVLSALMKVFAPDFLITASKGAETGGFEDSLIRNASSGSRLRTSLETRSNLTTTYFFWKEITGGPAEVVNISARDGKGKTQLVVQDGERSLGRRMHLNSSREVQRAANWLVDYHLRAPLGVWEADDMQAEIDRLCQTVKKYLDDPELPGWLAAFTDRFGAQVSKYRIPVVAEHGNFSPANILIGPGSRVAVIGWDRALPTGSPFMDVGAFLLSLLVHGHSANGRSGAPTPAPGFRHFVHEYGEKIPLPFQLAPGYFVLRAWERDIGEDALNPDTYVSFQHWTAYLKPALAFGAAVLE